MHLNVSVGDYCVCSGAGCLSDQILKVILVVIRVEDLDLRIIKFMINEYHARILGKKNFQNIHGTCSHCSREAIL